MKKKLLTSLVIIGLITSLLLGCNQSQEVIIESEALPEPITQIRNSINITIDPRIELMSIVQYLSNYRESYSHIMASFDFDYTDAVIEHFDEFKNHEVIGYFESLVNRGFTFDTPPTVMLHMNEDYTYRDDIPIEDYLILQTGGEDNINKLFQLLEAFSAQSGFNEFFEKNKEYYKDIIDSTLFLIEESGNLVANLEDYYGMSQESYNIVLVSLYGSVGYGPLLETTEGNHIYSIIGSQGSQFMNGGKGPVFGSRYGFEYLQNHEFSHSFINPITTKNIDLVNSYEELFSPIEDDMNKLAYSTWEVCLNEHIIRALTSRFTYLSGGDDIHYVLKQEKDDGFIYVEELFNKLEDYENNRDKYPTIEDFFPELLSALD